MTSDPARSLTALLVGAVLLLAPVSVLAQRRGAPATSAKVVSGIEAALAESWADGVLPEPKSQWRARLAQDDIARACSQFRNKPPRRVAAAIQRLARATLQLPPGNAVMGDWRRAEAIAQSGYGRRFTDTDPVRPNGGNCYACHRIAEAEVAYGTLGPSLAGYGAQHEFSPAAALKVYEQLWNPHIHAPCSNMPRFGAAGTLTIEQIKDLVAWLMARDSPVNAVAATAPATPK